MTLLGAAQGGIVDGKNGVEAALKQLGIEVVFNTAAGVGMSAAFKCGKTVFPSIKSALGALFDATPGLKTAFGSFAEQLVVGGEKLAETYVGKQAAKLAKNVARAEAKLVNAEEKILQKIDAKLGSGLNDLVEQAVPGSVARKLEVTTLQRLKPLGRGNTGRSEPENLHEQLVLEEIIADPYLGDLLRIKKGMTDPRWHQDDGWVKMYWRNQEHGIEVHFVAQKIDGVIKAIDDFKFKKQ